jgi:hypothetical protein
MTMNSHATETAKAAIAYLKERGLRISIRWRFPGTSPPSHEVEALLVENLGGLKEHVEEAASDRVEEVLHQIVMQYGLKDWFLQAYPPGLDEAERVGR